MPASRIERLRAGYRASIEGRLTEHADLLAPDFELQQSTSIIDTTGHFVGRAAILKSNDEVAEVFEDLRYEPQDLLEAPGGEIVVLVRVTGRGRGSGITLDNHIAHVWTFRDDQATRMVVYEEQAEALEAVGLAK